MLPHFLLIASVSINTIAYTLAAVHAHLTEQHQDMCPLYTLIAVAALIHLLAVVVQWWKSKGHGLFDKDEDQRTSPASQANYEA